MIGGGYVVGGLGRSAGAGGAQTCRAGAHNGSTRGRAQALNEHSIIQILSLL